MKFVVCYLSRMLTFFSIQLKVHALRVRTSGLSQSLLQSRSCYEDSSTIDFLLIKISSLKSRGHITVSVCSLYGISTESSEHLFLQCAYAFELWHWLSGILNIPTDLSSILNLLLVSMPEIGFTD